MMFLSKLKESKKKSTKPQKGFTLIELLVVIGILAVLLAIVLIAVNPPRQFALARNTQRRSDTLAILNGVGQFYAEDGNLPNNIGTASAAILSSDTDGDICDDLVGDPPAHQRYLAELPFDPQASGAYFTDCDNYDTGYTIQRSANNRITVSAPSAEDPDGGGSPPTIQVTR